MGRMITTTGWSRRLWQRWWWSVCSSSSSSWTTYKRLWTHNNKKVLYDFLYLEPIINTTVHDDHHTALIHNNIVQHSWEHFYWVYFSNNIVEKQGHYDTTVITSSCLKQYYDNDNQFQVEDRCNTNESHYKLNYAARYAKFIPERYFLHKKSRTISTLFLHNPTQNKNMPMHKNS